MQSSAPEVEQRDVLVLGSGEAGKYIAWNMAAAGRKTALIERRYIGGSCPNIACLPSKNVVYSAHVATHRHAGSIVRTPSCGARRRYGYGARPQTQHGERSRRDA